MLKLDEAIPQTIVVSCTGVTKNDKRNLSVRTNRLFQQLRNSGNPSHALLDQPNEMSQPMHRLLKRLRRQHLDKLETTIGENDRRCDAQLAILAIAALLVFFCSSASATILSMRRAIVKRLLKVQSGQLKTTSLNSGLRKASPRPKRPRLGRRLQPKR